MRSHGIRILAANVAIALLAAVGLSASSPDESSRENWLGQPVDIAPSAYQYRADRQGEENAPESWFALMSSANLPLNKPVDVNAPAIRAVLRGWLWEEIRPIQRLELTWNPRDLRQPAPEELAVTTLQNRGASSSWWNNLAPSPAAVRPTVSADGRTYVYDLAIDTCGIVLSVPGKNATNFSIPAARIFVAEKWKTMDVEIEWGFDANSPDKDYSGRIETYDGRVVGLRPFEKDRRTKIDNANSWQSRGHASPRRGVKFSLAYMGASRWRPVQPFTSQQDDVARTIVTLWTKAGSFSFLAADLENGPIYAPEYGFFVRRSSSATSPPATFETNDSILLTAKMNAIAGSSDLLGWGDDGTPWFGGNPLPHPVSVQGIDLPARTLAMHPGPNLDVAVGWKSPLNGTVKLSARVAHAQTCGNGIEWSIVQSTKSGRKHLAHGATNGSGSEAIPSDSGNVALEAIAIKSGEMISLVIGPKGSHTCDTTIIELTLAEIGGNGRVWNLTHDVIGSIHASNPHADAAGKPDVWHFYAARPDSQPSLPPISLASPAASAREFIKELQARHLHTIRELVRSRPEQTWDGAVSGMRGTDLPAIPQPPAGTEPAMQIDVPSSRLAAQWNLGAWHLVRHCAKNPVDGRLWFNDYPYGILGAETYMVLHALDLMGSSRAAEDGFQQWVSLPMDPNSAGHHSWALPDRPNGLFSEGHGCLTHAVGPPGVGGHMDGIHAFGPGSIGWALTEHFWLTGDTNWLRANAARITANAEWMLRQRRVLAGAVPGGERLWCKGLQPALQVTPDSGGLWMQFYECEAYYWVSIARLAATVAVVDPTAGARLAAEAESYRRDLRGAVERSIALSPVVPVRDGTYHSVIPFACYVRGLATGAWGWQRDGSGSHVGPLYWETVQTAAALISPAGLLPAADIRVQGYLDVLEDRLLFENQNVGAREWFLAGWQYQGGLERTPNMHLASDDIPVFIRSFLNCYAVDILPKDGYVFNEHAVHGPPDKIFEEAAFLERFRNLLVMETGSDLWLARGTPREWLEQGKKVSVRRAPTHFGNVDFEIVSDVAHNKIAASVNLPARQPAQDVWLRFRHPASARIKSVRVNGQRWNDFYPAKELINLRGLHGMARVEALY